jgi:hypothetical protein
MPAFSFEKISPPVRRDPPIVSDLPINDLPISDLPISDKKPRGVIIQILDRFVGARVKRTLRKDDGVIARYRPKTSD